MIEKIKKVKDNLEDIKKGLCGLKERLVLIAIISFVWLFLDLFQNRLESFWAVIFLLTLMTLYAFYMQASFKYKVRKKKNTQEIVNKNFKPFVSILIPAHNEEYVIKRTVENVLKLDYENFEIIVIDDRSTDSTAEVLMQLEKEHDKVKILIRQNEAFPGKSAVLNEALQFANGEAILVLDADAIIGSDFLSRLVPFLEPEEIGAVQARKIIVNREENFLTRCQDNEYTLDTHFQVGRDAVMGAVELRGNGELIKRKALESIDGWNNFTITDDLDMSTRMHIKGWDIRFCENICVYEEGILNFKSLLKQRRRWVEGAIRRYLENCGNVLFAKKISLRTRIDMIAYITQFILPFMCVSEFSMQLFRQFKGESTTILASVIVSAVVCLFYMTGLCYSIRHYNKGKMKILDIFRQGIETSIYFMALWFPLVFVMMFKILFFKKTMNWGKTEHGLSKLTKKLKEKTENYNKKI